MKFLYMLLLLITIPVMSQQKDNSKYGQEFNSQIVRYVGKGSFWISKVAEQTDIEGSEYLFDSWEKDYTVIDKDNNKYHLSNLNYNIPTKQILIHKSNDSIFELDLKVIDGLAFGTSKYKVINEELYEELFMTEEIGLYKQFIISIKSAKIDPLTKEVLKNKEYVKNEFYWLKKNNEFLKFKAKKSTILEIKPTIKEMVIDFVAKNKLSYSNEGDFLRILQFINKNN